MEIRHVPSCYYEEQLTSLISTQLVFFDEFHIQQVSVPPTTSKLNEHAIRFIRYEEGNIDVKIGKYDTKNQPKKETFKYKQEVRLCLNVARIESKEGMITGKRCPVFGYTGENIVTIDAFQKEIQK